MNAIIERSQRFLDRSLGIGSRVLLFVCAALIFPTGLWPAAQPAAAWVPFALGILALLFLRACVQGKVRDLLDVAVISLYFGLFLLWSSTQTDALPRLLTVVLLVAAAFVMAWNRAALEEAAEIASAG